MSSSRAARPHVIWNRHHNHHRQHGFVSEEKDDSFHIHQQQDDDGLQASPFHGFSLEKNWEFSEDELLYTSERAVISHERGQKRPTLRPTSKASSSNKFNISVAMLTTREALIQWWPSDYLVNKDVEITFTPENARWGWLEWGLADGKKIGRILLFSCQIQGGHGCERSGGELLTAGRFEAAHFLPAQRAMPLRQAGVGFRQL